jgi:hypothetical protein
VPNQTKAPVAAEAHGIGALTDAWVHAWYAASGVRTAGQRSTPRLQQRSIGNGTP